MCGNEETLKEFVEKGGCTLCGSQRCDGTLEWAQGCEKYQEFLKTGVIKDESKEKEDKTSV